MSKKLQLPWFEPFSGAQPTDPTSLVGTLYRSTGTIQQGVTEVGQIRMGPGGRRGPRTARSIGQGLEFDAATRRLGKQVIPLSYPDEPHHLGRRDIQKDLQVRMRQFFDHYPKGTPAPAWMTEGGAAAEEGAGPDDHRAANDEKDDQVGNPQPVPAL